MAAPGLGLLRVPLLTRETADETTSQPVNCLGYTALTVYVIGSGTLASGVITIEEADFNPSTESTYTGDWSTIATVNATDVSGGKQLAYHIGGPGGLFAYSQVRTRISTGVTGGGNISTVLVGV